MPGIAEKFLSEREISISSSTAADFYATLQLAFSGTEVYAHSNVGAPVEDRRRPGAPVCFYRGQSKSSHGLSSSLYRLIKDRMPLGMRATKAEDLMADAERRVLKVAQANGIVRGLTSLESLTILQHHGAPTRLIDVSSDWRAALYFACEENDGVDGRLFAFSLDPQRWIDFPRSKHDSDLVWWDEAEMRSLDWKHGVWPVLLPFSDARMVAQRGFFLVGGLVANYGGHNQYWGADGHYAPLNNNELRQVSSLSVSFSNELNDSDLSEALSGIMKPRRAGKWTCHGLTVRIPSAMKVQLREMLSSDGVSEDSIYPPLTETTRLLKHVATG
ncbi:MAG: FRG domain-containing protein [Propionibacterium sp.]|nr:FRG domain-containing protein [Propionibacterium sp.]